jgi:hypothetical protein
MWRRFPRFSLTSESNESRQIRESQRVEERRGQFPSRLAPAITLGELLGQLGESAIVAGTG